MQVSKEMNTTVIHMNLPQTQSVSLNREIKESSILFPNALNLVCQYIEANNCTEILALSILLSHLFLIVNVKLYLMFEPKYVGSTNTDR